MEDGALRVIGGRLRSRRLSGPPAGVRPTADRVRESLFSRLEPLEGVRVLDLFAGTGALGIEAISRGASVAVFVDSSPRSLGVLRENLDRLEIGDVSRVVRGDASKCVRRLGTEGLRFDLVFLDPPYDSDAVGPATRALVEAGVLAPGATVVVESASSRVIDPGPGLALLDERRYGDTLITRLVERDPGSGAEEVG